MKNRQCKTKNERGAMIAPPHFAFFIACFSFFVLAASEAPSLTLSLSTGRGSLGNDSPRLVLNHPVLRRQIVEQLNRLQFSLPDPELQVFRQVFAGDRQWPAMFRCMALHDLFN